jgi:hypothetical protein
MALSMCGYNTIAIDKGTVTPLLSANMYTYERLVSVAEASHSTDERLLNHTHASSIQVMELDWYAPTAAADIIRKLNGRIPDLIVCSDCVYQQTSVSPLMSILNAVRIGGH